MVLYRNIIMLALAKNGSFAFAEVVALWTGQKQMCHLWADDRILKFLRDGKVPVNDRELNVKI